MTRYLRQFTMAVQESMTMAQKKRKKRKQIIMSLISLEHTHHLKVHHYRMVNFNFDLWGVTPSQEEPKYDWDSLRKDVMTYGVMNSLLVTVTNANCFYCSNSW